jgi:hypothetical protein
MRETNGNQHEPESQAGNREVRHYNRMIEGGSVVAWCKKDAASVPKRVDEQGVGGQEPKEPAEPEG